ncbi:cobalamin biosynthesis protein [Arsenicicoccus dermatophilus]|uniref:cobalamin biosynthesis protein n=1 Tax=Arsenicicoccus dermatophilus TaxID=1076331 RepID=UPI001F4CF2BA|nr:cobalamin biosynthesis protein [Arsenicicoccus dermatophilus]
MTLLRCAGPRATGLVLGWLLDAALGDPRRGHPVAAFGQAASRLERVTYRPARLAGAGHVIALVGPVVLLSALAERGLRDRPVARCATTAVATWTVLGGTSLAREGAQMARLLETGHLPRARARLSHLCSRSADGLGPDELARAATESLGENTADAVVAPLLWGAVAGLPGLLGYRAVNTLDAMVGYRNDRYREFGWAAARLDDLANLAPARMCAAVTTALASRHGGDPRECLRAWREDAPHHPSPNAGPVEATFAGALGVRLGGSNSYDGEVEDRGVLGRGRPVGSADLARAVRLSRAIGAVTLVVASLAAAVAERSLPAIPPVRRQGSSSPGRRCLPAPHRPATTSRRGA